MRKVLVLFGQLRDRDIDWLVQAGEVRRVAAGTVLIEEGRPIDAVHILLAGALEVTRASTRASTGASTGVRLASLAVGEVVGEMSFLDGRPPSATVRAVQDSHLLTVPRAALSDKLEDDPAFAARLYRSLGLFLSDRLRGVARHLGYHTAPAPGEATADLTHEGGDPSDPDELDLDLDPAVLDRVAIAGDRFSRMLTRLGIG